MRRLLSLSVLAAVSLPAPAAEPAFRELTPEQVAEEVESSRGGVLVVHAWATTCPPCLTEFPDLARVGKRYAGQKVRVLALSMDDDTGRLRKFLAGHGGVELDVVRVKCDQPAELAERLRGVGVAYRGLNPFTAVVGPDGKVSATWTGAKTLDHYAEAIDRARGG